MGDPPHIVVLTHARQGFATEAYTLALVVAAWEARGLRVSVARGTEQLVEADLLWLHVDLTVVPDEYLEAARRYPISVNGGVSDISKRSFASGLVRPGDGDDGPVIVKTDRNYGGLPERRLLKRGGILQRLVWGWRRRLPWAWTGDLDPHSYPVYARAADVPRAAWHNRRLIVQRFVAEREGELYCARNWTFLGDREVVSRVLSPSPVVKASNAARREFDIDVPDELRRLRERLGFDYGKFDFTLLDGVPFVYDVNPTPTLNRSNPNPRLREIVSDLALGIDVLLARGGPSGSLR